MMYLGDHITDVNQSKDIHRNCGREDGELATKEQIFIEQTERIID